ncbi:hypothetical protein C8R44DRAFT_920319 [Mycena epipterygia]|nr:hypothetical protein C8R44DRAFT_920319 [Mycena epipterygia]
MHDLRRKLVQERGSTSFVGGTSAICSRVEHAQGMVPSAPHVHKEQRREYRILHGKGHRGILTIMFLLLLQPFCTTLLSSAPFNKLQDRQEMTRGENLERADEIENENEKSWPRRTHENLNNSMSGGKQDPISQNKSEDTAAEASSRAGMKREAAAEKIESNLLGIPNRGRETLFKTISSRKKKGREKLWSTR